MKSPGTATCAALRKGESLCPCCGVSPGKLQEGTSCAPGLLLEQGQPALAHLGAHTPRSVDKGLAPKEDRRHQNIIL